MTINRINFPIYELLILFSIIVGALYIWVSLNKENLSRKHVLIFFMLFFFFTIFFGKLYTYIEHPNSNFLTVGVTGYGGLIGGIFVAILSNIIFKDNRFFKYTIISTPLIYSFAKLACFFNGCCIGIPYNGPFAVTYPFLGNASYFPIQLVETIVFLIIFSVCNTLQNHKNITYITLILILSVKFLLDFLRNVYINKFLSNNQIMSIILFVIVVFIYFIKKYKKASKKVK